MSVTLSEVKRAAKAHRAPLAGESVGYLVLAVADQVLNAPRLVQASEIQLTEDGALRVLSGRASSEAEAELGLRQQLDQLLLVASSGSAALTRAGRRTTAVGLPALVRELEAALIPVNRAAAKRALARVHRETARALASGTLPPEASAVVAEIAGRVEEVVATVSLPQVVALPFVPEQLDGVLSALSAELAAPPQLEESDALTVALDVRMISAPAPLPAPLPAVEEEPEATDSGAAPTVMRAVDVAPIALTPAPDFPVEARTRPEPVVLRKSQRPEAPSAMLEPAALEMLPRTPTMGSWAAALPVLAPERIAELDAAQVVLEAEIREAIPDLVLPLAPTEQFEIDSDDVLTSLAPSVFDQPDERDETETETEAAPEVVRLSPLPPGIAMVPSRQSDVSELLASFHVRGLDAEGSDADMRALPRAIKEMADLDLTPAPFAALIR